MFADVRAWPWRRWMVMAGVSALAFVSLTLASGALEPGAPAALSIWWVYPLLAGGSTALGLVIASYVGAPVGAAATFCDLRWPLFGLTALHLGTDFRSVVPLLTGPARPVLAAAAVALLVWALRERLTIERRAHAAEEAGDVAVCSDCRPLYATMKGAR